jgi:hypothetical protein
LAITTEPWSWVLDTALSSCSQRRPRLFLIPCEAGPHVLASTRVDTEVAQREGAAHNDGGSSRDDDCEQCLVNVEADRQGLYVGPWTAPATPFVSENPYPVLENPYPVLENPYPVLENPCPVLEYPYPNRQGRYPILVRPCHVSKGPYSRFQRAVSHFERPLSCLERSVLLVGRKMWRGVFWTRIFIS